MTASDRPVSVRPAVEDARPLKRSFRIRGHATSISLEQAFWTALKDAATLRGVSTAELVAEIDASRGRTNLSSAVRVWLLRDVQAHAKRAVFST